MTDADVQFVHTDDATPYLLEKKASAKGIAKFERQRLMLFSDCIIFVAKKKVGTCRALFSLALYLLLLLLRFCVAVKIFFFFFSRLCLCFCCVYECV